MTKDFSVRDPGIMSQKSNNLDQSKSFSSFEVSKERGFLPLEDPLLRLPALFDHWEEIGTKLPKYMLADNFRTLVDNLPKFEIARLKDQAEIERAMVLLSYIGHAYVWGSKHPPEKLPSSLAIPWYEVSTKLGRPPVLSYSSYMSHNWRRFDKNRPLELGNIAINQNFLGGIDEEWFILVHVDIEARAGEVIAALWDAQDFSSAGDPKKATQSLVIVERGLSAMYKTLERMPEHCDSHCYFHRVRPYIHGWKNHPALPQGLIYEGVAAYKNQPQMFRGETGAQSSIIPTLDAGLGVKHKDDPLKHYLVEMKEYMPPKHRAFIDQTEKRADLRAFVEAKKNKEKELLKEYNACVEWIEKFRSLHLEYAATYIYKQLEVTKDNPSAVGTGGTPFMPYLGKHRDETGAHKI